MRLFIRNTVIESPYILAPRYYETTALYPISHRYFEDGFGWSAAPKPKFDYEAKFEYIDESELELTGEDIKHQQLAGGRL